MIDRAFQSSRSTSHAQLSVERLHVVYDGPDGPVRAVEDVSFTMDAGEVLALVGESGSGKTSVGLALARLLPSPPARVSGAVRLGGQDLLTADEAALRRVRGGTIAYVFQDPGAALNPVLTVGRQLREALELHTSARGLEARRRAAEWLARVGLAEPEMRLASYPHELSGGMQQRVCLAMALAAEPALLVADEPTSALDVTVQAQILRLLRDLQRALRLSILLISHDLLVVERMAHRVGVMRAGGLVEAGPVSQVLGSPAHPYTRHLLACRNALTLPRGAGSA